MPVSAPVHSLWVSSDVSFLMNAMRMEGKPGARHQQSGSCQCPHSKQEPTPNWSVDNCYLSKLCTCVQVHLCIATAATKEGERESGHLPPYHHLSSPFSSWVVSFVFLFWQAGELMFLPSVAVDVRWLEGLSCLQYNELLGDEEQVYPMAWEVKRI